MSPLGRSSAKAREVAWGERLFAQLLGGMSPGKADWVQSLGDGAYACHPWGVWGAPFGPFLVLFPKALSTWRLVPGLQAPGAGTLVLLFPLLPAAAAAAGCLPGLVPRDGPCAPYLAEPHVSALLPGGP